MPDYDLGTARGVIELDASSLGRASAAFTSLGTALLGFSAVALGGFGLVVKAGADFEKVMSAVEAVSGATADEMNRLKAAALELGSTTTYSANEIGRAMEQLAKAGLTVDEILGGATEATVTLAAAAGDELAGGVDRAAEVIANAMRTFGAGADEMDHFADVIVGAAASSTISVDDLATTLTYAGPIAASTGMSIDELSTAIAILGDRGIRGSTAGTSLRGVLISLGGASGPAKEAMRELGLITEDGTNRFYDLHGSLLPLPEIMQILGDATRHLSDEERTAAFNAIFQRRAMNSAMILAEAGAEGFYHYADAIASIDASNVAATKLDNLAGDMTLLQNSANALAIAVGLELQEGMRGLVQSLTDLVHWLQTLDPAMLANILRGVAFTGVIMGILGAMAMAIGISIKMYTQFRLLAEGIRLVAGAMRLLTLSMLTNPWVLLAAAVIAIGAAIYYAYQNVEPFRNLVDRLARTIVDFVTPGIEFLRLGVEKLVSAFQNGGGNATGFIGFMQDIGAIARSVYDFITITFLQGIQAFFAALSGEGVTSDGFVGFLEHMGVAVRDVAIWLRDVGVPALIAFGNEMISRIGPIINTVAGFITGTLVPGFMRFGELLVEVAGIIGGALGAALRFLAEEVLPRIGWLVTEVAERFVSGWQWVQTNVGPIVTALGELFNAIFGRASEMVGDFIDVINFLGPVWRLIWNTIQTVLQQAWTIIVGVFTVAINFIQTLWRNFGDNLWSFITQVWDLIKGTIENALEIIKGIIQVVTGIISGDWAKVWEGIQSIFEAVWDFISEIPGRALDFIVLVIQNAVDLVITIWQTAWDLVKNILRVALENARTIVSSSIGNIVQFFVELPGRILSALGNLGLTLWQKGLDLVQGMVGAIINRAQYIMDWATGLGGRIIGWIGNVGSLLWNAGREIIQGLIDGIQSMISRLTSVISGIANTIGGFLPGSPVRTGPLKVLNQGYAGGQIVKMLADGIARQQELLTKAGASMGATLQSTMEVAAVTGMPTWAGAAQGGTSNPLSVELVFPNVTSAKEVEEIKEVLSEGSTLEKLTQAIRAGVGRNR